jgi:hypothetical protein
VKNPTCKCGKPATLRCAGCGRYLCPACNEEHQAEIAEAIEAADALTDRGRHAPRERNR